MIIYAVDMQPVTLAELKRRALPLLDESFLSDLSAFRDETAAIHKLTSYLLVRAALSLEGFPRGSYEIRRDSFGKPFADGISFHFNVSHSGRWCVCALSPRSVGVDVQIFRDIDRSVAARFFSPEEALRLEVLSSGEYLREFFRIWSLKESYIKCIGKGLSHPLNSFTVAPCDGGELFLEGIPAKTFEFRDGYSLAACAEDAVFSLPVHYLSIDGIL